MLFACGRSFFYITQLATSNKLKVQLGEEPLVLAGSVLLLKSLLNLLLGVFSGRGLLESLSSHGGLQRVELKSVTSGHQVVVVDDLDEGLDSSSLGDLLFAVLLGHLEGVSLNTSNQGVAEWVRLGALIMRLDDDHLLSSVSAADNDSNFARLEELSHC